MGGICKLCNGVFVEGEGGWTRKSTYTLTTWFMEEASVVDNWVMEFQRIASGYA